MYSWTKGAPPDVIEHLVELFEGNSTVKLIITHLQLDIEGAALVYKQKGKSVRRGGSMIMYFYKKEVVQTKSSYRGNCEISYKINAAFKTLTKYKVTKNKNKELVKMIFNKFISK